MITQIYCTVLWHLHPNCAIGNLWNYYFFLCNFVTNSYGWVLWLFLWKNHKSLFITNQSQLKKRVLNRKCLGPLWNQTVNLETDAKTLLQFTVININYNPSIYMYLKQKKTKNKCASLNNSHRNHTKRIFYQDIFKLIDHSLHPTGHRP